MSIDVNVQNDLVIVTESSEDIVVNVSNAAGPAGANGVGVPVGGATGQVLKKFTNTDYDTYWAADASGLTSVGLSMPTAFTVSNTPLTTNGTLAVTGAGTAAQYIRGDGQLATFPSSASGGSSVNYYLNGSVNASVAGYKQLSNTATIGGGTDFTLVGNGLIAQFLTDVGNPNRIEIPGGAWNFEMFFQVSSSGGNQKFYVELLKYNGTTFTSIASSSAVPEEITGGTAIDLYLTSLAVPTTALLITDRLVIRVYIVDNAVGRTITLHTEDNTLCEIVTTFAGGIAALNGLSANTQYLATGTSGTDFAISSLTDTHTFNLPTASGTNRGALSSADWTTFSGKVGGTGTTGQVAYWNGTNSQTGSNNLFWDAANARLGIGTNTPTSKTHIVGAGTTSSTNSFLVTDSAGTLLFRVNDIGHITLSSNQQSKQARFFVTGYNTYPALNITSSATRLSTIDNGILHLYGGQISFNNGTDTGEWGRFMTTGNLVLQNGGTFTDGGQRLQVYGDAFIKGSGNTSATTGLTVQNSNGENIFRILNDGYIRIGNTTSSPLIFPQSTLGSSGDLAGTNISFYSYTSSQAATLGRFYFSGNQMTQTSGSSIHLYLQQTFIPSSGTATNTTLFVNPQINQTGGANGITRGLYVNPVLTAAADWRSIEWSNNSGWGLYGVGTANNYLAGRLLIGTTSIGTYALDVVGGIRATSNTLSDFVFTGANSNWTSLTIANTATNGRSWQVGAGATNGTVGNSNFFINDSTSGITRFVINSNGYVGLNKTSVGYPLDMSTATEALGALSSGGSVLVSAHFGNGFYIGKQSTTDAIVFTMFSQQQPFIWAGYNGTTIAERMRLTAAGRLLLGTTTEGTFLLDVNGTARVSGYTLIGTGNSGTPLASLLDVRGSADADFMQISRATSSSDRYVRLFANGSIDVLTNKTAGRAFTFEGSVNSNNSLGDKGLFTSKNTFSPTSAGGGGTYTNFEIIQTINQTGGANGITRGLYINATITSAADWRAIEVSAGVSVLAPSSTASATLRIPSGTAPTSPVNGDIWFDGTNLFMQIGGVTKTFTLV